MHESIEKKGEGILLKDMEKKLPSQVNLSKDEIKRIVSDLKRQDWITLPKHRAGRDGGTGNYHYIIFEVVAEDDIGNYFSKEYVQKHVFRMTEDEIDKMQKQIKIM